MQALYTVFWGVLVLSLLVFIHEGGHYLAANLFGARVTEFFLGFPSKFRIAKRLKKRGTLVGVTPLLIGGYVRISGMDYTTDERLPRCFDSVLRHGRVSVDEIAQELECDEEEAYEMLAALVDSASIEPYYDPELGEYEGQSKWPRAFQTVARDASGLTVYDSGHDVSLNSAVQGAAGASTDANGSGHEEVTTITNMPDTPLRGAHFATTAPATMAQATLKATRAGCKAGEPFNPEMPVEDFLKSELDKTYLGCKFWQRIVILAMGPLFNLLTALLIVIFVFSIMGVDTVSNTPVISEVAEGSLALDAGLAAGDTVLSIGGYEIKGWDDFTEPIQHYLKAHEDFDIVFVRDGVELITRVELEEGKSYDALGVYGTIEHIRLSPLDASVMAFNYAWAVASHVVQLLMPSHTMEILNQSSSVVGIAAMTSEAAQSGIEDLLMVAASISMSLCFMNLLPIPPLDGGKILIEIIQVAIRRPLSKRAQTAISYLGLAFFLAIFMYVLRLDIMRLMG